MMPFILPATVWHVTISLQIIKWIKNVDFPTVKWKSVNKKKMFWCIGHNLKVETKACLKIINDSKKIRNFN